MRDFVAEQPVLLCIGLGILAAVCLLAWLQTGQRPAGIAAVVLAALVPVGWFGSHAWVTDREQIRQTIDATAAAIESNDPPAAAAVIADPRYRDMAMRELPRYTFEEARVTGERKIEVDDGSFPLTAEADLIIRVKLTGPGFGTVTVPRRLILDFEKFDDVWMVTSYRHMPPVGKADMYSNVPF